jgi:hypothetical protein
MVAVVLGIEERTGTLLRDATEAATLKSRFFGLNAHALVDHGAVVILQHAVASIVQDHV